MKDLVIIGTGVHALEMAEIVERINRVRKTWNLLGYISQGKDGTGKKLNRYPVLGPLENLKDFKNAFFVPDNNAWFKSLDIPRKRCVSVFDPSAFISRTAKIGAGCVIYPNCYVGLNAKIGDFVFCLSGCVINHDDIIGDRTILASGVTLAGNLRVGEDCYLGQSCTVRQFARIGAGSLVGMGSVVLKDVEPGSVVCGNPARKLCAVKHPQDFALRKK
jgi:sugar O-acyltransferase (sialic acid O-acetyltransferase NeuD family)